MKRQLKDLRPHQLNAAIYSDTADENLIQSIREHGLLHPLLIDYKNRIISGHRRYDGAKKAKLEVVSVEVFESQEELDIQTALIEANRQRIKTTEQMAREAAELFRIEKARARQRQSHGRAKTEVPAKSPEAGEARELTGRKLGIGGKKVEQAVAVIAAIDRLNDSGDKANAEKLRNELNHYTINRAYEVARESGLLHAAAPEAPVHKRDYILVKDWARMSEQQRQHALSTEYPDSKFTSQETDSIEWARHSWNPVTGCSNTCGYCYAREVANHLFPQGFKPSFYPGRLKAPTTTKLPHEAKADVGYRNVFTGSMTDLFGPWVPSDLIQVVLNTAGANQDWNFLLLTKYPERLAEFSFPANAWVGTTVDSQARVKIAEQAFEQVKATVKWISCEPMLERITFSKLHLFNWLVIGGASRTKKSAEFRPDREWVQHLWAQADAAGVKVYEKPNLLSRRREYPMQTTTHET